MSAGWSAHVPKPTTDEVTALHHVRLTGMPECETKGRAEGQNGFYPCHRLSAFCLRTQAVTFITCACIAGVAAAQA